MVVKALIMYIVNMGEAKRAPSWVCHWCVPKIDGSSFSFIFPLQNTLFAFFFGVLSIFGQIPLILLALYVYIYTTIYIYTYCRSYNITITSHCITRYIYTRIYIYIYVSICIHIYIYITYIILLYVCIFPQTKTILKHHSSP